MHDYESLSHVRWDSKYHVVIVSVVPGSVGRFSGLSHSGFKYI